MDSGDWPSVGVDGEDAVCLFGLPCAAFGPVLCKTASLVTLGECATVVGAAAMGGFVFGWNLFHPRRCCKGGLKNVCKLFEPASCVSPNCGKGEAGAGCCRASMRSRAAIVA